MAQSAGRCKMAQDTVGLMTATGECQLVSRTDRLQFVQLVYWLESENDTSDNAALCMLAVHDRAYWPL
jgi:hypothetical protein